MAAKTTYPVLTTRALGRATLDRQSLLRRSAMSPKDALTRLVGLQAQNVKPPYVQLAARLEDFDPEDLSALLASREAARMVTMRSTIHLHTADDCLALRPLFQAVCDRELRQFRKDLAGIEPERIAAYGRELVEERPRPVKELRELLLGRWPDAGPLALTVAVRCLLPLVQTTPRGLWGRSGQVTLTTTEQWFGRRAEPAHEPDAAILRYLAAFGPASVRDAGTWSGLTRLREVFERLRPGLLTFQDENGVELFDLPEAARPAEDTPAPPRFLPEFDNLLLSHADRTRIIPAAYKGRLSRGNLSYRALLVDGMVAGVWRLALRPAESRDGVTLTVQLFGGLSRERRRAVEEEGERLLTTLHPATAHDLRFADFTH
ncbi:hypothetical protein QR77_33880 [Streptomyces sp. 150FB]|uniref:winged helix DNA-binding domain-containing protein n=1 Tax=Streptomyces sp. 150FB TaxID=1576605 RepID=UPI0005894833|nr:winged helix DNA-binding domain-containing protein [Streptomyces sp. 150FB]KIF77494.1 hypothetical protein QR77_33880 [Streptomyces sp. 150FB]